MIIGTGFQKENYIIFKYFNRLDRSEGTTGELGTEI